MNLSFALLQVKKQIGWELYYMKSNVGETSTTFVN